MNNLGKKQGGSTNDAQVAPETALNLKRVESTNQLDEDLNIPEESKVGQKLSDLTTRRVIILVLAMMFSVPIFTLNTYQDDNNSFTFGLELIREFTDKVNGAGWNATIDSYITQHEDLRTPLVYLACLNVSEYQSPETQAEDLRASE